MIFIGLDGEMSSSELHLGGKLIQIGAWEPEAGAFTSDLGWPAVSHDPCPGTDTAHVTDIALEVNRFTPDRITSGPDPADVDTRLASWLRDAGAPTKHRGVVSIGFNVGAFDLPFVKAHLPQTATLLSRRTVDLNAVVFTMAGTLTYSGGTPGGPGWKRLAKRAGRLYCEEHEVPGGDHDAGYDAAMAYGAWQFLRQAMAGTAPLLP